LESVPDAHLILIGEGDPAIMGQTRRSVSALGLEERVSFLGGQENIMAILDGCDVGVLSSVSEGFPLVLLEFGHSHLATVATAVGASAEILDQGRAGLLVPPSDPQVLADAVLGLLRDRGLRAELGEHLYERVTTRYSEEQIVDRIIEAVYEPVLRNLPGTQP
jgi:glycosyltransferase involved in cell wall biosynthesis